MAAFDSAAAPQGNQALIKTLEARIAEKKQENADLRKQMFQIQRQSAENEQTYETRIRELTTNVEHLKSLNERLIKLNQEMKEEYSKESDSQFKTLYWKLLVVHEESEKKRRACEDRIVAITKKYDEAVAMLNEERDSKYKDEEDQKVTELKKALEEMRGSNEALRAGNVDLQRKVDRAKEKRDTAAKLREEVFTLREENQTLRSELANTRVSADASELEALRKSVEESDLRETAMTLELEKAEKMCAKLQKEKEKLEADLKVASSPDVSSLCSEISALKKQITSKDTTLTGLTTQLKIIREENARLKKRMQTSRIEAREKLETSSENRALEQKCEKLKQENDRCRSEITRLETEVEKWQLKASNLEQELEQQKRKFTSQIDMITRENEQKPQVNNEPEDPQEQNQKISQLKEELNEAKYIIHQLLSGEKDEASLKSALEYLDVIKTLEEKLRDSEMIHKKSLKERDEYRKKNAQLAREVKTLKAIARKNQETVANQMQITDLQNTVNALTKRVEENESFKKKMLQKMKEIKDENADLKKQLSKAKSDIENYRFQLAEMREQLITTSLVG